MDKLKKYFIRGVSILMASLILVASPASKYLDTQGISDTHASSLVTGVLSLGAAASLALLTYNVIVPEEHEMVVANEVFNWVEEHVESARESIAELRKGAVTWVIDKTVLEGVKHYLESKGVNPEEPHTVSMSANLDKFTFDTLPGLSDVDRSNLRNLSISNVALINQYLSGFRGFYSRQVDDGKVISSFWEIDLSEYDGAFKNGFGGLSFYKLGDIDNAVELRNIAYRDDGANLLSNIFKFTYYPDVLTQGSFDVQTFSEFCDSRVDSTSTIGALAKSFAYENYYGSYYYPLQYLPYYNGTSFLYSSSVDNAVKGIYEPYPNTAEVSGTATSYGGYSVDNVNSLAGSIITSTLAHDIAKTMRDYCASPDFVEADETTKGELITGVFADTLKSNGVEPDEDENPNDKPLPAPYPSTPDLDIPTDREHGGGGLSFADGVASSGASDVSSGEQAIIEQSVENANGIIGALNKVISALSQVISDVSTDTQANTQQSVKNTNGLLQGIRNVISTIGNGFVTLWEWLGNILEAILAIPQAIINGIANVLRAILTELFVPDTEAISEKVAILAPIMSLKNTLGRFIEPFKLIDVSEPPHMYIHFENAEDERFQKVGTLKILDMAWYEPYKAYGDLIFSSVIWLFFILRLRKSMPSILNGLSGGGEVISEFKQ